MLFCDRANYLDKKFHAISGMYSGIIRDFCVYNKGISGLGGLNIITGGMPNYTKITIAEDHDMSYHISGYGNFYEEAYIRFLGESVERYAGIVGHEYSKYRIEKASYNELTAKGKTVMPLELMHNLSLKQLKKMHDNNPMYRTDWIKEDEEISWVKAFSMNDPNKDIYVPASLFFVGFMQEQIEMPAFTTGTACHENIYKAFINAIIEYVQIDAFMIHWYSNYKKRKISFESFPRHLKDAIYVSLGDNAEKYELLYVDYSDVAKVKIPIVGVFVMAKDEDVYPRIAFGVQAGTDMDTTLYRGTQEALAVLEMSTYTPINNPQIIKKARDDNNEFFDLDSNVAYYSIGKNEEESRNHITQHICKELSYEEYLSEFDAFIKNNDQYSEKEILKDLIKEINKISKYGCFLDLTPEIDDPTMRVIRCFIPELMQMSFPGFPYVQNSSYKKEGVKIEYYPHPLP